MAWERDDDTGEWVRAFTGTPTLFIGVSVWIYGQQRLDGTVSAWVSIETDGNVVDIGADVARELGALLAATAEDVDRLNGDAPPF